MNPTQRHRIHILLVGVLLFAGLAALGWRLYGLHVTRHVELAREVNRQHERRVKLPSIRGLIVDCNANVLAHSVPVRTVVVDPHAVREDMARRLKARRPSGRGDLARILSQELTLPREEVERKLDAAGRYVVLKRKVPEETVQRLQETLKQQRLRGLIFEDDQIRVYPNGSLMSHVLGYVNAEQRGMEGVERMMQNDLGGEDGWRWIECDNRGREILIFRNEDFPARNGYSVMLTLDQAIQNIVEQELERAVQRFHPDDAVVIVMRPATGEILAMTSRPTFDPNAIGSQMDALRNRAVADENEPGSTFKIVTVAAGLDQRIVNLSDVIWCENGRFLYGGRFLNDHEPFGHLTVAQVLERSSNIGVAKIALMLGKERMHQAMRNFGCGERALGEKPLERWPSEIRGTIHPLRNWSKVSITRVSMGHEVAVTPLQMANAICALANGGNLMRPQIIKRVLDQNGKVVREFFPQVRRRVVDRRAAQQMTEALKRVVSKEGTAMKAAIPGFEVAGKTGTAQKLVNREYVHDQFVSSFIGYFPANDPEICIYAMLDNPKGKDRTGGSVAAPLFHDIGVRVASYLNLKPTMEPVAPGAGDASIIPVSNRGMLP